MRLASSLLLALSLTACHTHTPTADGSSPAYGLVLAQARTVVEHTWGTPQDWDTFCRTKTRGNALILSLDPRLVVWDDTTYHFVTRLPAESAAAFLARRLVDRVCTPPSNGQFCDDTTADMNVVLWRAEQHGPDTLMVALSMSRDRHCPGDHDGFGSNIEFTLLRSQAGWFVKSHRVAMIT